MAAVRRAHPAAATQGQAAIIWELDRARAMLAAGAALEEVLRPAGPADFQPPMKAAEVRLACMCYRCSRLPLCSCYSSSTLLRPHFIRGRI